MARIVFCWISVWLFWAGWFATCRAGGLLSPNSERLKIASNLQQKALARGDSLQMAEAWYLFGKTYVFSGDDQTAQQYFLKSLRIQEPRRNWLAVSQLYARLSEIEIRLGRLTNAMRYASRSLQTARRSGSDLALSRSYGVEAYIYSHIWDGTPADRGNYERLLDLYRKRQQLCRQMNDSTGLAEVGVELGILYTRTGNPKAIPYLEDGVRKFTLVKNNMLQVRSMMYLSAAYIKVGKHKLALPMLQEAEKLINNRDLNGFDNQLIIETNYVRYFQATGQWRLAFDHQQKLHKLEKSQLTADNNGTITRLNIEYETDKREALLEAGHRELSLRTDNLHSQQRSTLAMGALFLISSAMSCVLFLLNRKNRRISRQNETLVREQNHRVKNNLQVVASLLSLQASRLTDQTARRAVEESRLRVESMAVTHRRLYDGDQLAQVQLKEFFQELVDGVLYACGHPTVEPVFIVDDITLSADKAVPLGLILNELTTNACKYAFPYTAVPRFRISCLRQHDKIRLTVEDNGPGLHPQESALDSRDSRSKQNYARSASPALLLVDTWPGGLHNSFGMTLVQAQVSQLGGTCSYGSGHQERNTGFIFTMYFSA